MSGALFRLGADSDAGGYARICESGHVADLAAAEDLVDDRGESQCQRMCGAALWWRTAATVKLR